MKMQRSQQPNILPANKSHTIMGPKGNSDCKLWKDWQKSSAEEAANAR